MQIGSIWDGICSVAVRNPRGGGTAGQRSDLSPRVRPFGNLALSYRWLTKKLFTQRVDETIHGSRLVTTHYCSKFWGGEAWMFNQPFDMLIYLHRIIPTHNFGEFWMPTNALEDRKSTRLNSSHLVISYAVFC